METLDRESYDNDIQGRIMALEHLMTTVIIQMLCADPDPVPAIRKASDAAIESIEAHHHSSDQHTKAVIVECTRALGRLYDNAAKRYRGS